MQFRARNQQSEFARLGDVRAESCRLERQAWRRAFVWRRALPLSLYFHTPTGVSCSMETVLVGPCETKRPPSVR